MKLFYRALTNIFYPIIILLIFFRKLIRKEDGKRYKEKIFSKNFNIRRNYKKKLIWFHAASVGELKSIISIINNLNNNKNNFEFLISTLTLSSANLANEKFKIYNNVHHRFLPVDVKFLIEKFITLWKPSVIFLVDSEIWPNLIFTAKKMKIPLGLINARITNKTYKRWCLIPNTAKSIFGLFDLCLTSNLETKKYLDNLKAKNVHYLGNIKFCENYDEKKIKNVNEQFLSSKTFWLAASTHPGEENFCLLTHLKIKKKIKNIITIIAPRHIERSLYIKKESEKYDLNCQILNSDEKIKDNKEIIIINSYGNLASFFKNSKSAFIGKSIIKKLEKVGGQNPLEAAKQGCKIYHGPYVYNFKEIYEILEKNDVSKKVYNTNELSNYLIEDYKYIKEKNFKFSKTIDSLGKGILSKTINKISDLLIYDNI